MTLKLPALFLSLLATLAVSGAEAAPDREEIIPLGTDEQALVTRRVDRSAAPRVELFGQVRLGNRPGAAASAVKSCGRPNERVSGLRFRVLNSPAALTFASVQFGNGARRTLPIRANLAPNSDTGWLDLRSAGGRNPCVKAVVLHGQNGYLTPDSAIVQIFGLVSDALPREPRDARRAPIKIQPRARLTVSLAQP